jgi:large subunit ribosomal protein L21
MQGAGVPLMAYRMLEWSSHLAATTLAKRQACNMLVRNRQALLTRCSELCIIPCSPASEQLSVSDAGGILLTFDEVSIMYAVIKTGGKQYKVVAGEKLKVEQIPADIGSELTIDQVLALGAGDSIKFGAPLVEGASVLVKVVSHGRHDKVRIFKMRRRKHYQKRQGHRQNFTEIQVVSING